MTYNVSPIYVCNSIKRGIDFRNPSYEYLFFENYNVKSSNVKGIPLIDF